MNTRILIPVGVLALCSLFLYLFLYLFFATGDESNRQTDTSVETTARQEVESDPESRKRGTLKMPPPVLVTKKGASQDAGAVIANELAETPAQRRPAEETRWVDIHVRMPENTPSDEAPWIVALAETVETVRLHDEGGPFDSLHAGDDPARLEDVVATARADFSGITRIGLPLDTEEVWLAVGGSYVYTLEAKQVDVAATSAPVELRPVLGAKVTGQVLAPVAPGSPTTPAGESNPDVAHVEVNLRWSIGANLQLGTAGVEALNREAFTDDEGRFAFHAVPTGKPQTLTAESETLAIAFSDDLTPAPGEHVQVTLAMLVGGSITGRVVNDVGEPVDGAAVHALGRVFFGNPTARLRETESDAEGRFHLTGVASGNVFVRVRHPDYQDLLTDSFDLADGEARDQGDVVITEGLAIAGTVLFPDDSPAADVAITIAPDLSGNIAGSAVSPINYVGADRNATTDENGVFRLTGAGPGPWVVTAQRTIEEEGGEHAPGLWAVDLNVITAPSADLRFVLNAPIDVTGEVADGEAIPMTAFTIHAERAGSQWYMPPSETRDEDFESEDGTFRVTNLRSGDWTFTAVADGFARSAEAELTLPADESLSFVLLRPVLLAGQVLDPDGNPVAGAEVSKELEGTEVFEAMQGRGDWPTAKTDDEGFFKLEGLAPGTGSILAKRDGFAPSEAVPYELEEGDEITDLVLSLRNGGVITGEVFGADGKPSGGCMLILQMPTLAERRITNTHSDGTFEERGLTPGQWQVQAFPGVESLQSESGESLDQATLIAALKMTTVILEDNQEEHVILGEPPANPVSVHGVVRMSTDTAENAMISFIPTDGGGMDMLKIQALDADGSYAVVLDEPGDYLITIQVTGTPGRQSSVEFRRPIPEGGDHRLDFEMPQGRVSGRVVGPDGSPRASERVTLNMEGGLVFGTVFGGQYNEIVTDEDGEFDIHHLRPGQYAVAAGGSLLGGFLGDSDGLGRIVTSVSVAEGQWVRGIDFRLEEPGTVHGTVRDMGGALVKGASIFMRDEEGHLVELFSMSQTNASGSFDYTALAPGNYTVIARTSELASPTRTDVQVRAGETAEVTVIVDAGTVLLITLIDKSGADVPSRVSVLDANGRELSGMFGLTELMERYSGGIGSTVQRIGPVPPGEYRVRAFAEDGRSTERKVTVRGKAERKVKLRLK